MKSERNHPAYRRPPAPPQGTRKGHPIGINLRKGQEKAVGARAGEWRGEGLSGRPPSQEAMLEHDGGGCVGDVAGDQKGTPRPSTPRSPLRTTRPPASLPGFG